MKGRDWLFISSVLVVLLVLLQHEPHTYAQSATYNQIQAIQLTESDDFYWPSWSLDGSRIALYKRFDYYINRLGLDTREPLCHLWIMNLDGSNLMQLWNGMIKGVDDYPIWPPHWSCNGDLLAVEYSRDPNTAVILDSQTGEVLRETLSSGICWVPRFSPTEDAILFSRLIPAWEHEERIDERSIVILNLESGHEQVIHTTRFRSETEWREWPSVWSQEGNVVRVRDSWRKNIPDFFYYDVRSGELLLESQQAQGSPDLPDAFPDPSISPSNLWHVIAPHIHDDLELPNLGDNARSRRGLRIARLGEGATEPIEYLPLDEGLYIFSYQWHPDKDVLLLAAGEKSLKADQPEISNIYILRMPD